MNTTLILALLFVVLVNVQIFATKEVKASYGSFLIGSIWIILIALMALAVIYAKNKFVKLAVIAFIVYCLVYPYLGGFEEVRARQLSYLALILSLLITSGIVLSGDYPILKYFIPTNIWLFIAVFFLVEK